MIRFTVAGAPQQQGSKTPWGSDSNDKNLKPYRGAIAHEAMQAMRDADLAMFTGPVAVFADLFFPRPKSHYRTGRNSHILKPTAAIWHASPPDADKVQRAIGDALTGVLIQDDRLISCWVCQKHYGTPARTEITVTDTWSFAFGTSVRLEAITRTEETA